MYSSDPSGRRHRDSTYNAEVAPINLSLAPSRENGTQTPARQRVSSALASMGFVTYPYYVFCSEAWCLGFGALARNADGSDPKFHSAEVDLPAHQFVW